MDEKRKARKRVIDTRWRHKNKEKERQRWHGWYAKNREYKNHRSLAYYYENKEQINERRRTKRVSRAKDPEIRTKKVAIKDPYIKKLCNVLGVGVSEARRLKQEADQKQLRLQVGRELETQ